MKGYLITFEGPDGAGKTTVIEKVAEKLRGSLTRPLLVTREPGGSAISETIRQIILDPKNAQMSPQTEALLYAASRSQHVHEVLKPALTSGKVVLSDRFVDSSLAYQGYGRRLGIEAVEKINDFATNGLTPDLTLFLDLAPRKGLERIMQLRPDQEDRLEREKLAFHEQVYQGYQLINEHHASRIVTIDASAPLTKVVACSVKIIKSRLPQIFQDKES